MPRQGKTPDSGYPAPDISVRLRALWRRLWGAKPDGGRAEIGSPLDRMVDVLESMPEAVAVYDGNERLQFYNSRYRDEIQSHIGDILRPGLPFETLVRESYIRGSRWKGNAKPPSDDRLNTVVAEALARHRQLPMSREKQLVDGR